MKINWLHIKLAMLLLLLLFLFVFTSNRNNKRTLASLIVKFDNPEQLLLSEKSVNKLLIQNKGSITNIKKESLDLNSIEKALNTNSFVRKANLYVTVNGDVGVAIAQKKPLARVHDKEVYYIDEEGEIMPLSSNIAIRVPLVTGEIDKKDIKGIFKLVKQISEDNFFKKQVEGIHVKDKKYTLLMREFDFEIDFGASTNCELKLKNFKAFYQKALKDKTINKYSKVNLQIASQVVCTKK